MNKLKYILFAAAITLLFISCGGTGANDVSPYSARQMAEIIIASQSDVPALQIVTPEDSYFAHYFSNSYKLGDTAPEDSVIYYAGGGVSAIEFAVFLFDNKSEAEKAKDGLLSYIKYRTGVFRGYDPIETEILEKSIAVTHGRYAVLLICRNTPKAKSAFLACFGDNPPELVPYVTELPEETSEKTAADDALGIPQTEPDIDITQEITEKAEPEYIEIDDFYNPAAILDAWNGGGGSLSVKNKSILNACADIIAELITDDMDDYAKELAVHDWIINWADYDKEANSNAPDASPDPDNNNPYGLLFSRKAICSGYSSTFQLFMDLLGIECITVHGTNSDNEEHAWNMVRIEGAWYCVDVTWNDPSGMEHTDELTHKYFNVTSDFMQANYHRWDRSAAPEADSGKLYK